MGDKTTHACGTGGCTYGVLQRINVYETKGVHYRIVGATEISENTPRNGTKYCGDIH